MAFDVDGLVHEPDELQRLMEGLGWIDCDPGSDVPRAAQLGVALGPCGHAAQAMLGGRQECRHGGVGLALPSGEHTLQDAGQTDLKQLSVARAQVALTGQELVLGDLAPLDLDPLDVQLVSTVAAPQVAVLPVVDDVLWHLVAHVAAAVRVLGYEDLVLADAKLHVDGHRAGRLGQGAGDLVAVAHVEGHGLHVLAEGHRLAHDPRGALGLLEDARVGPRAMEGDQ